MNTVLYYPHLYPPTEWFRVAALCWDEVYTLQPDASPNAPEELTRLDAALGGILRVARIEEAVDDQAVASAFDSCLSDLPNKRIQSRHRDEDWFALLQGSSPVSIGRAEIYLRLPAGEAWQLGLSTGPAGSTRVHWKCWPVPSWRWACCRKRQTCVRSSRNGICRPAADGISPNECCRGREA
jgi:hypothetical protein